MEHAISSLIQLFSFSHRACDAILQARGISVPNAYYAFKHEDGVYVGFVWVVCWEVAVVGFGIYAWLRKRPSANMLIWRYACFLFATFGLVGLSAQLEGMVAYSDVCRRLVRGEAPGVIPSNPSGGAIYITILGLVILTTGAALLFNAPWYIDTTLRAQDERPAFYRGFAQRLGLVVDRRGATVQTYALAAVLSLVGLLLVLGGIAAVRDS